MVRDAFNFFHNTFHAPLSFRVQFPLDTRSKPLVQYCFSRHFPAFPAKRLGGMWVEPRLLYLVPTCSEWLIDVIDS